MNFNFIKHSDCELKTLSKIIKLKQQHWNYSTDSQIEWMKSNVKQNDIHLIISDEEVLIAYLQLSSVIDINKKISMLGIGNVCVNNTFKKQEYGYLIIKIADFYIRKQKSIGILMCKKELVPFYKKCNWHMFDGLVEINGAKTDTYFLSNVLLSNKKININRSF